MKRIISLLLALLIVSSVAVFSANADDGNGTINEGTVVDIEYLDNGDYIVTIIEDDEIIIPDDGSKSTTVTKTKASNYYNSSGTKLWCVKVQGTFTYNGTTSVCNSAAHQAVSYASSWSIVSASHSKSGNTAKATATARHHYSTGYNDYTRSVTLKCSATGVFT